MSDKKDHYENLDTKDLANEVRGNYWSCGDGECHSCRQAAANRLEELAVEVDRLRNRVSDQKKEV